MVSKRTTITITLVVDHDERIDGSLVRGAIDRALDAGAFDDAQANLAITSPAGSASICEVTITNAATVEVT